MSARVEWRRVVCPVCGDLTVNVPVRVTALEGSLRGYSDYEADVTGMDVECGCAVGADQRKRLATEAEQEAASPAPNPPSLLHYARARRASA